MSQFYYLYKKYFFLKMKRVVKLTKNDIHHLISEQVLKRLNEINGLDSWYDEEDYDGNVGEEGMVRSYDIGYYALDQAEIDAEENGYDDVGEYLKYWFSEIQSDCPWTWQRLGSGYGYHGSTIFDENGVECKDIYGQIMFDEYPPE